MKGSYKIIPGGDATKPVLVQKTAEIAILCHIVNSVGLWGSGMVVAISRAFGESPANAYKAWHKFGEWTPSLEKQFPAFLISADKKFELGKTQFVDLSLSGITVNPKIIIASMVAQEGIGFQNGPPIRYEALKTCMENVGVLAGVMPRQVEIHTCKFGSERAGGNFKIIETMIQDIWVSRGLTVVIYDFDAKG